MSWFSENYEKAAIGAAAAVVVGLGFAMWSSHNAASGAFDLDSSKRDDDASVSGLERIESVNESLVKNHEIVTASVNDRSVNLFTSVPLFVNKNDVSTMIDLEKDAPVHEGIDNNFWLEHGLDPGFENAPQLDPDEDGFTNMDEYVAKTSPVDFGSHPDPVLKLAVVSVDTNQVHIKPNNLGTGRSTFRLEGKLSRKTFGKTNKPIMPGDPIVFNKDVMKERFKYIEINNESGEDLWEIEDLRPNKKGKRYFFNKKGNMPGADKREFGIMDSTVEFELKAIKQGGKTFKVEENNKFSLPKNGETPEELKEYLFKSIDLDKQIVTISYTDENDVAQLHTIKFKK